MECAVVVQVDPPGERAGRQHAVLGVVAGAGVADHGAARVGRAAHRLRDARRRHRILRDRELRGVAGRGAERVRHDDVEERAVVGELDVGARIARAGRAGDWSAVAAPLKRERRAAGRTNPERGRLPDRDRAARRLQLDSRRLRRGVPDAPHVAGAAREIIERAVRSDLEVHGSLMPVAKLVTAGSRIQSPYPARAVVGEEVLAVIRVGNASDS